MDFRRISMVAAGLTAGLAVMGWVMVRWCSAGEAPGAPATRPADGATKVGLVISGGYELDERDGGRPVILIAAALKVTPDVFRKAFSGATPARGGERPEASQVRRNKAALLRVLEPHGVTNDRLDEVSNRYRYNRGRGEMWTHRQATGFAMVRNGVVTGISMTEPGYGYTSAPRISIETMPEVKLEVNLGFSTDFKANGSIESVRIAGAKPADEGKPAARRRSGDE